MKCNTNSSHWEDEPRADGTVTVEESPPQREPKYISFGDFVMNERGLSVALPVRKGGGARSINLSGPFEVIGRARDPKSEGWARLLRWRDDDGRVHLHAVADADLHGDASALCGALARKGLRVVTGVHRLHFIRYLNGVSVSDRVTTVDRCGWHDIQGARVFVLPNLTLGEIPDETIIVESTIMAAFEARGSLADWRDGVGRLVSGHARPV